MITNSSVFEIRVVDENLEKPLAEFFRVLVEAGDYQYFHPHPLTNEEAKRIARYTGKDLYCVLLEGKKVLAYGMLRGWDEGFAVPSLGIAVHPAERGKGIGKLLMHFLHTMARRRGADKIRVKVYPDNKSAVTLYKELGYTFEAEEAGQLLGFIKL